MKSRSVLFSAMLILTAGCTTLDVAPHPEPAAKALSGRKSVSNARAMVEYAADKNTSHFKSESGRLMAYQVSFTISVKLQKQAHAELKQLTESLGGYILSSNSRGHITLKVPVKNADEFLKSSEKYGKLRDFTISADDLTDTITDTTVRLDNLKKFRERLTALLAKTTKVDEILKIERELNRITTESERLTARLQNDRNRVNFVTFDILVIEEHGALPGGNPVAIINFPFLQNLTTGMAGNCKKPLFGITLPQNFVTTRGGKYVYFDCYAATTADDCMLHIWEQTIPAGSTIEFWQQMVCRALEIFHSHTNIKAETLKLNGRDAVKISAERLTDSGLQKYMTIIEVKRGWFRDKLQIVEYSGPENSFKKYAEAIISAVTL